MYKRILCPIDLDVFTEPQLTFARGLARDQHAQLIALHVIPMPVVGLYDMASLMDLQKVADDYAREGVLQLCGTDIEPRFAHGIVEHQTMKIAKERNCDLIVMPTHGYRGFKKFFFGSVFQSVIARSEMPVMALPPHFLERGKAEFMKPDMILCAIDLEKGSEILIELSEKLAAEFKASFIVMHSVDLQKELLESVVPRRLIEFTEDVKAKILRESSGSGGAKQIIVEKGPAYDQIVKQAVEMNVGLVILGVAQKSPLRLRSTLYRTVAQLGMPALCVPVN
jgi:nucleotide-binding universal stress UspA family protein